MYQKVNNIVGWIIFIAATTVYYLTMEASGNFWDCGEFAPSAFKLQVAHSPGAPFFLLVGRIFTFFAGDISKVAASVTMLSVLAGGFTILFLFWTITALAKKTQSPYHIINIKLPWNKNSALLNHQIKLPSHALKNIGQKG